MIVTKHSVHVDTNREIGINPLCGGPQAPGLAVVLVGSRKDSETYVRNKKKACAEVGITDFGTDLPEDALEEDVLAVSRQTQ